MSPKELSEAALRKLMAEVDPDLAVLQNIASSIHDAASESCDPRADGAARAFLAVELHRYYTALETTLERIIRIFDDYAPTGDRWHQELLAQAARELPGVRPAVLQEIDYGELTHLLSFRHFFRHAYAVPFDWRQLEAHRQRVERIHGGVAQGLQAILDHARVTLAVLATEDE